MLTTNAAGTGTGTFTYDPFGNKTSASLPTNMAAAGTFGWVGEHEKFTEKDFVLTPVQMGVRVYLPTIGRFTSVDPVEGGVENNYVYPPDPVNGFDLTGTISFPGMRTVSSPLLSWMAAANRGCGASMSCRARVYAKNVAITGAVGFGGVALSYGGSWLAARAGLAAYGSRWAGVSSTLFGNERFGGIVGRLNNYTAVRIGWSHYGTSQSGVAVFRIAITIAERTLHVDLLRGPKLW